MADTTYTADKLIGVSLYAKKSVPKLNSAYKQIGTFNAGDFIGQIYSWVSKNGSVYWFFYENNNPNNKFYLVKHEEGAFNSNMIKSQGVKTEQEILEEKKEQEEKDKKGAFIYYLEKYGKYALIFGGGILLLNTIKVLKNK